MTVDFGDNRISKAMVEKLHCEFRVAIYLSSIFSPFVRISEGSVI